MICEHANFDDKTMTCLTCGTKLHRPPWFTEDLLPMAFDVHCTNTGSMEGFANYEHYRRCLKWAVDHWTPSTSTNSTIRRAENAILELCKAVFDETKYPPPPVKNETYLLWMQDYDYAGVTLVEGPPDADIEKLKAEYNGLWKAAYCSHEKDKQKARDEKLPEPAMPEILEFRQLKDGTFQDSQTYGFACWLVENKGFKHVEPKRFSL